MTPQIETEIKGNFFKHPFAELVTEISLARLNGSLRASDKEKKYVVYFKSGKIVFAASNARSVRLFEFMLQRNRLTKQDLAKFPNFPNDIEFAAHLEDTNILTKSQCAELFTEQIEAIIVDILSLPNADWSFSSLTRIRDGLAYEINTPQLLVRYARCLPVDNVLGRFRSLDESFSRTNLPDVAVDLYPDEAFVLSRFGEASQTAAEIVSVATLPQGRTLQAIYTLWVGGLLVRNDLRPAFSASQIASMRGARLEIKREARMPAVQPRDLAKENGKKSPAKTESAPKEREITISLDEYLERVENAQTYYDILGINSEAEIDELKRAYFTLARSFHPDKYHYEGGETLKRIQHAFTQLAQAHETLKNDGTREIYDYRMRKEIAEREKHRAAGTLGERNIKLEQAEENFGHGFTLLTKGEAETALPFLARAVHYSPKNARYHAYYGKALSADDTQRHKAESEMQAALRIDPNNATFRLLLAEFFIQKNLLKRAEGELTRLLAIFPSNRDANELLDRLKS